jgi:uncharacterized protein YjbI with pentapeptide repeats
MDFVNETGLEAAWIVGQIHPPASSLTALVKGTFRLRHGDTAVIAEEQRRLTGDQFESDDPAKPLRYAADFALFKPRADVLLSGTCYAPGGAPVPATRVGFRLGPRAKALVVYGDRKWLASGLATDPVPFASLSIAWEQAYGGPGFPRNPLGRGFEPDGRGTAIEGHPLPNIEYADRPLKLATDRVEPAGFGPIPDTWPQRLQKFGTIDSRYTKDRWPLPPGDMDWGFFNAAPEDQQIESYLRGDEELYVENLHPGIPKYRSRLPGIRVRSFLNERVRARYELREIPMQLDTVWIDMDSETLVLVWRGHLDVRNPQLIGSEHFFVATESLAEPPQDIGECERLLEDALTRRDLAEAELEAEEEPGDSEDEESVGGATPAAESPDGAGVGTASADEAKSQEAAAADESPLTAARVKQMAAERASFAGCDLSGLTLAGLDLSGLDFREAIMPNVNLAGSNLSQAHFAGAMLAGGNLRAANCAGANLSGADLTEAWLTEADLSGADLSSADLTKARLRLARLSAASAVDAIFAEADVSDASFEGANLAGTDFCNARIHRTDFSGANLTDAAFEDAWGRQVKAVGATLIKVRGANAVLCEGNFGKIVADESVWEAAELFGCIFSGAVLNRAEFSGAYLADANFDGAEMKGARLDEATLRRTRMRRCNLLEASLDRVDLTDADLSESNLFGASLIDPIYERTTLALANLRRVKSREVT